MGQHAGRAQVYSDQWVVEYWLLFAPDCIGVCDSDKRANIGMMYYSLHEDNPPILYRATPYTYMYYCPRLYILDSPSQKGCMNELKPVPPTHYKWPTHCMDHMPTPDMCVLCVVYGRGLSKVVQDGPSQEGSMNEFLPQTTIDLVCR